MCLHCLLDPDVLPCIVLLPVVLPCRTCESMSAEALVVPSRAVLQTDAFKKQSRTSERWLRILEVGLPDLTAYLLEQRAAGYTLIGKATMTLDSCWCWVCSVDTAALKY